jgi:hypothetical protein
MAHPGALQGLDEAISADPRVTWVIHGWQIHEEWTNLQVLEDLFAAHPNLYYTIDFAESLPEHLDLMKNRRGADGSEFLPYMESHLESDVERMGETWGALIEAWPDRFTWGTDMARPGWQWTSPEVLDAIVLQNRVFLGTLRPDTAEAVAWRNAERALGPCDAR